jgi:hypothetical protein
MSPRTRPIATLLLVAAAGATVACGSPTDQSLAGPAHATVTGRVTSSTGAPIAATPVEIACAGGGSTLQVTTDSAGRYVVNLVTGAEPFSGRSGQLPCHFTEPGTISPRAEADTALTFARGTILVIQQIVDLQES